MGGRVQGAPGRAHRDSADAVDDVAGLAAFVPDVFGATGELIGDARDARIMISGTGARPATPAFLYVYVDDADATYRRAIVDLKISYTPSRFLSFGGDDAMYEGGLALLLDGLALRRR